MFRSKMMPVLLLHKTITLQGPAKRRKRNTIAESAEKEALVAAEVPHLIDTGTITVRERGITGAARAAPILPTIPNAGVSLVKILKGGSGKEKRRENKGNRAKMVNVQKAAVRRMVRTTTERVKRCLSLSQVYFKPAS